MAADSNTPESTTVGAKLQGQCFLGSFNAVPNGEKNEQELPASQHLSEVVFEVPEIVLNEEFQCNWFVLPDEAGIRKSYLRDIGYYVGQM
jgi:hypothetical protein